ncbi:hypothetical protein ACQ86N_33165 [Puia sp. P3]|uniref:hypothetical protein n=1 Tax=Puia sp. P3 TaxID=3423952 RepID=UPI003D674B78
MKWFAGLFFLMNVMWVSAADIWVSPSGNDGGDGSRESPMATIGAALRRAREMRRLKMTDRVTIWVRGGEYVLTEPLFVRPEDSGVTIAAADEGVVVSGGVAVNGWRKGKGGIWEADAPGRGFRQLWVNGVKAVRAREEGMPRILGVDKKEQVMWVPAGKVMPSKPDQVEMVIHQMWAIAVLRVKTIEKVGDRWGLRFGEPEGHIEFEHPWPAAVIDSGHKQNGNSAYYLTNAIEIFGSAGGMV